MSSSNFQLKVSEQITRLSNCSYRMIEHDVAERRVNWINDHRKNRQNVFSPRQAFELLFFEYMDLRRHELPVQTENENEIVWSSQNACPTLEACKQLKLDTRETCRAAYEKSTQAFLSQLDPQLRFQRSYEEIRPYTDHCLERIVRVDFNASMLLAIEEAKRSKLEGNKGYGALVTLGDRIIGKAHDTTVTEKDPSLHAEVNAIRQAVHTMDDANLSGAILFSTCEPCPMCSSLAVWANLTTIVYGASIQDTLAMGRSRISLTAEEIVESSPVMIEVIRNIMGAECRSLYV